VDYQEFAKKVRAKYPGSYDDLDDKTLASKIVAKYPVAYGDVTFEPTPTKRAYEALRLPQQFMSQVFEPETPMSTLDPNVSPSVMKTLATGTPRVIEETGRTIGKAIQKLNPPIPEGTTSGVFYNPEDIAQSVSRGSLLTMGALKGAQVAKPAVKAIGSGIGRAMESISGLEYKTPGILKEAFNSSKVLTGKGKEVAKPLYQLAKNPEANLFEGMTSNAKIVDKANEVILSGGKIEPSEALTARKAVDALISKKDSVKDVLIPIREKLDVIAKANPIIAKADELFASGIKSGELRRIFPVNKSGGTSIMKSTLGTIAGLLPAMAMSPAVQGTVATGAGIASKAVAPLINNPAISGAIANVVKEELSKPTRAEAKEFMKQAKREFPDLEGDALRAKAKELWKADKLRKK
jgi:hypothetical protein